MTDLHGHPGRTMSAGEAALRAKLKVLANALLLAEDPRLGNTGQLIADILTGEYDPRQSEVGWRGRGICRGAGSCWCHPTRRHRTSLSCGRTRSPSWRRRWMSV